MKIIFLDHDGVICLSNNWGSRHKKQKKWGGKKMSMTFREIPLEFRFDDFDKKAVSVLNEILEETGAEIITSSDWRLHATIDEMGDFFELQGVIKRPIGFTEFFKDIFPREWAGLRFRADLEFERHKEIQKWLSDHNEVTHWVAVDDLDMSTEFFRMHFAPKDPNEPIVGLTNFVHTPRSAEGIKQVGVKEKIVKLLNG
jgi:hypothetical protein